MFAGRRRIDQKVAEPANGAPEWPNHIELRRAIQILRSLDQKKIVDIEHSAIAQEIDRMRGMLKEFQQ